MRIVIALGGNALLQRGQPMTAENQRANIRVAAERIAAIAPGNQLVIAHGNGPQVGLLALQDAGFDQPRQAIGQDIARDAERFEELFEMPHFVEGGAQDHERPSFTHGFQRRRKTAEGKIGEGFAKLFHDALCHTPFSAAM